MKNIAMLLPARANIATLEIARQGFLAANEYLAAQGRPPGFAVQLVAATPNVVMDSGRYTVRADALLRDAPPADVCVVPPLQGEVPAAVDANGALIGWLSERYRAGGEVASLCVGAALPAAGGLLDGQRAVVHWVARNQYEALFPRVSWVSDRILHSERGLYTSGGAFSAAHLVLHLVEKYTDRDTAIWCAKFFQLDWNRSSQLPFAVFAGQKSHADTVVRAVQDDIELRYAERLTVEALADRHALGRRTLERRFRQATGASVVEYLQRVRVEVAKKQLETTRKSVAEVMYQVGYSDTKAFRDTFNKYSGMSPVDYRERYL
ncbi:AraC family transcriptional regulator [Bordetella genomosp. 1]|uniref:AraC family transcriptional regulator n=1 Tax=Bordetella genomosp. 1 TaxID=1395607 RepID=A0A261SG16_9BORD|nr:helix-turn-helix domain-containing protein [Bordetella genomosp. 1]OZI35947.1 AraC family transcriptional regulator [Bordetella genomosp. 1]OZI58615.1 AraC family transcriptional regulator [Bordetella genomosp. 1]